MTSIPAQETVPLLTRAEVSAAFRVRPRTVTRWANAGKLTPICTPGGHRRYLATQIGELLAATRGPVQVADGVGSARAQGTHLPDTAPRNPGRVTL